VWGDLFARADGAPESVHLARWPTSDAEVVDTELAAQMALVRRVVELGRGARAEAKVRTRQPLARALVSASGWERLSDELRDQVAEELNVQALSSLSGQVAQDLVDVVAKANFRSLGARYARETPRVAEAIAAADPAGLARSLREHGAATLVVAGIGEVRLTPDDVVVTETPREGWSVASEAGASVAIDLQLDEGLLLLGVAREVIRLVQEARKSAGFDVSDRIDLWWESDHDDVARAIHEHSGAIAGEVLALSISRGEAPTDASRSIGSDLGLSLAVRRAQ